MSVGSAIPTEISASELVRRPSKTDSLKPTYGFDDVSLAPGTETLDPADVDTSVHFGGLDLAIPILASAMDAVVDAPFAGLLAQLGGLAVLNLEGVQTRYDDPAAILEQIATAARRQGPRRPRPGVRRRPSARSSLRERIAEIKAAGSPAVVAATPAAARKLGPFCAEHGADMFLVQSQVSSRRATSPAATRRCRWPSSPGSCRSPSPWATRPTTWPRSS